MITAGGLDVGKDDWKGIEIGCGITPMKDNFPNIIASDILDSLCSDLVIDATDLSPLSGNFNAIFAVNSFHHISNKREFLLQCKNKLPADGKIVILEPADTFLSQVLYPYLFKAESYSKAASLDSLKTEDPEIGANQAASYICFKRDSKEFLRNTNLKIKTVKYCSNWISFILSGGTNFPTLAPLNIIKYFEDKSIMPKLLSLHWIVVLEKDEPGEG